MLIFKDQFAKATDQQKENYSKLANHFDARILTESDKIFFLWLADQEEWKQEELLAKIEKLLH